MRSKILIVEDNTELLELFRLGLSGADFTVLTATDGLEGLRKARLLRPHLLVLDLVLPKMDGFALCEAVRKDRRLRAVPIILLTGLTSEFAKYAGLECGANEYVTKPVSPAQLLSKIKRWLAAPAKAKTPRSRRAPAPRVPVDGATRPVLSHQDKRAARARLRRRVD